MAVVVAISDPNVSGVKFGGGLFIFTTSVGTARLIGRARRSGRGLLGLLDVGVQDLMFSNGDNDDSGSIACAAEMSSGCGKLAAMENN